MLLAHAVQAAAHVEKPSNKAGLMLWAWVPNGHWYDLAPPSAGTPDMTCPTITDSLTMLRHVPCIGGATGEFQFVGKGGVAPYTYTLSTLTGNVTNSTGYFNNLVPKDYRITVTDVNGCTGTRIRTLEGPTDFTLFNNAGSNLDWTVDSISTTGGFSYNYIPNASAVIALKPNGDSLSRFNQGNINAMSKFIQIGFPFKFDNFYYDSLVISEDGVISFNRTLNPSDPLSQWYQNTFYRGSGTYASPIVGDCQCDTAYLNRPLPFIAPFRDDMQTNSTGSVASKIVYALSGTAPNRIFTIEWRNMRWNRVCNTQRDNSASIQLELYEGSNKIRFHYKPEPQLKLDNCGDIPNVVGYDYTIGLFGRRLGPGNYLSINPDSSVLYSNGKVKTNNKTFPSALGYSRGKHFELTPPNPNPVVCEPPLSIVSATATCSNGSNTGVITITATGGLFPSNNADRRYFFSKNGGKTYKRGNTPANGTIYQDTFRNLAPGTYRIAVRDSIQQSFVIQTIVVPNTTTTASIIQPITCNGGSDGQIRVSWRRSSPLGMYDLRFQDGATIIDYPNLTDSTQLFTGLNAGTYNFTVTYQDYGGCTTTAAQTLTDPPVLTYTPVITQPACPSNATTGTKTGSVVLTAAGGVPSYTFTAPAGLTASGSTSTTRTYTNVAAGNYIFTVSDARGCTQPSNVSISIPNYAINNIVPTNPLCNSGATGALSLNVTGGSSATYTSVTFGGSASSNVAQGATLSRTNLAAASYGVSVTDGTCTYNVTPVATLTAPSNVVFVSAPTTIPTCFGGNNGQMVMTVAGGTMPYMYSVDNGANYQSSNQFTTLTSGFYTIKAKDANNCPSVTTPTVSVGTPSAVGFTTSKTDVTCANVLGTITVFASGGAGSYQYSKDGGTNYQPGNVFSNLSAGTYQIQVKDGNACTATISPVTINPAGNCCPAAGTIWYVDGVAASGGTGTSWACAFQNVQDAINAASSGHEIWVKAGTYKPASYPSGCSSCATDRDFAFLLKNGVKIYGGFAGGETLRSQRNATSNVTTLSGDIGTANNSTDNCYHVVLSIGDGNTTELDGFVISGGNANGSGSITTESNSVSRNLGGGMCNIATSITLAHCTFSANTSFSRGGGLSNINVASCAINDCAFTGNVSSGVGGGISNDNSSPQLSNCIISGNDCSSNGGGIANYSGSNAVLTNCLIVGNRSLQYGGGVRNDVSNPSFINCVISGNRSINLPGGGMMNGQSNPIVQNCVVWNNRDNTGLGTATSSIHYVSSTPVISYSLVQNQNPSGTGNLNGITNAADANYPGFATPLDPSTAPSTAGDFHLSACSPVLNLGDNTGAPSTDLFGNARIFGGTIDLGVHELQATATSVVALCKSTTVQLDGSGNATLTASALDNSSTGCAPLAFSATPNAFTCANLGPNTVTLTVTGANGATATCSATVTVADQVAPNALCRDIVKNLGAGGTATVTAAEVNNLSNDNCGTVNLVGVTPSSFTCANIGMNTVTLTVNDGHGNTQTCNATVTVADNTPPTALCQNISVNLSGNAATVTAAQVNNGSSDNCGTANLGLSTTNFTCANVGNNSVVLTVNDGHGNTATCAAVVTVSDATNPTALCQNVSVNLSGGGSATVAASQVNNGSSDNCGIAGLVLSTTSFTCANVGPNPVTLTVTDNNGRTSTCTATVTVSDATNPTALCQNVTVNLDGSGNASLAAAQVDGGSSDNCGIAMRSVTPNAFTTGNIGPNTVTLTVTDNNARTAACTATVTVTNTNLPNAVCQPYTAVLNGTGMATVTAANVNGGSSAVGGIQSLGVSPNGFTCGNLGANTVTLTVTGNNGLTATCNTTVTVQDNTPPTAICQNIAVNLSGNNASITAAQILNAGASTDNCGTVNAQSVSLSSFTCSNIGANTVTLTANDGRGNTATCTATVTVNDNTPPMALCQNITVNLGAGGTASIGTAQVNNGSTDNCGTVNLVGVSPSTFTCANIGPNTVTLTVNDGRGNTATCAAIVTVRDNTPPTALCRDVVLQLDANGNASLTAAQVNNGSSDNCALGTLSVAPNAFSLANLGLNTVTLTVPDANGNSATCTAQVTVENNQLPNAVCQNITRSLGTNGQVTINAADIDGGSTALGGIAGRSALPSVLTCANLGANTVALTITGNNGRQASCNATVTINDNTPPTAVCQSATVALNGAGAGALNPASVLNAASSSDNCGMVNAASVAPSSFTCANLGPNTVTLTANDGHGNTASCTATVTVSDNTPPTLNCQNITATLLTTSATITAAQIHASSSDNCGVVNLVGVSPNTFTCANLGPNTVTLTANDGHGNTASCTAVVTVADQTAPTISCPANQTVSATGTCQGTVGNYVALVTKSDNCTATNSIGVTQSPLSGTPISTTSTITLTATDAANNSGTCVFSVSIRDVTPPTIGCPANQTVTAATACQGMLGDYVALATKSDNCSAPSNISVAQSPVSGQLFTGSQLVTLTATDLAANINTCSFVVAVVDGSAPSITCPANQTVSANSTCQGTVGNYVALATKSDNCTATNNIGVTQSPLSGTPISTTSTITLTATDAASNSATCIFSVSIRDLMPPTVGCPTNQTVTANATCQGTLGNYVALATKSDNCSAPGNISVTQTPTTGQLFTGSQTVVLTASDFSENTATCSFVVSVVDNTAPTINCPANQTVSANASCQGTVGNYVALPTKSDNCTAPNSIGVTQAPLSGSPISAPTTVVLTATDGSNNSATCSFSVSIRDATPPSIGCPAGQTVSAATNVPCVAVVSGLDATFSDLCSSVSLSYALSGATAGSGSGQASGLTFQAGATTVTYTATDGPGNTGTCTLTVYVNPCQVTFTGVITWKQDNVSGVKDATVTVTGDRVGSTTTALNGTYSLTLDPGANFTLTPSKNLNKLNGVNALDVQRLQQHLNGGVITNPWQLIAADVNSNNVISALDVNIIQLALLGNTSALDQMVKSWRFVPKTHTLASPPWGFPENIVLTSAAGTVNNLDFWGIKVGDVAATYANPANSTGTPLVLTAQDQALAAGQTLTVDVTASALRDLSALQFALRFDPEYLQLDDIQPLNGLPLTKDNFGAYQASEGSLRVLWSNAQSVALRTGAPLFRLRFTVLEGGMALSGVLGMDDATLLGQVFKGDGAASGVSLRFEGTTAVHAPSLGRAQLLQNQPNPFAHQTTIGFTLPEACEAQLRIVDAGGRVVAERRQQYFAGRHAEVFELTVAPSVLYYELTTPFGVLTRKMVVVGE